MIKKLIFIVIVFLTSCASRKVLVDKTDIKKDSIVKTEVKVTTVEDKQKTDSTNIITNIDSSEIVITPIDSSKTIMVDGKSYKNVVLKIKKSKTNSLYINKKKESNAKRIDSTEVHDTKVKERMKGKTKIVDKKTDYVLWGSWIILILILYLLWRNKHRILNIL